MTGSILTFDLGTTRLKVALFTRRGRLLAQRSQRHVEHRAEKLAWQDADEWWSNAVRLTKTLLSALSGNAAATKIAAISLSGRGDAAVFIGSERTVIGNPWSDRRHAGELKALLEWRKNEDVWLPNYAAALLAKKQWFVANDPIRARHLRHVLYGKDYLLYRLTQQAITDYTSGPDAAQWDQKALDHCHTSASLLPKPALPWAIAGGLSASAAQALGIPIGTPVVVGGHDGICANIGAGAAAPGSYAVTLGTHAVIRAITNQTPAGAYRFYGLPPNRQVIGGNALMGGRSADWFLDLIYGANDNARSRHFKQLDRAASLIEPGAFGARFLPFLAGQIAPRLRPRASGVFFGLRATHDRAVLYRALLEGVAFALGDIYQQLQSWCGEPTRIRLTGSGSTSPVWCQILANVFARKLEASDGSVEGRGAAILAAVALGDYASDEQAAEKMVPLRAVYEPQPETLETYRAVQRHWRQLIDATDRLDSAAS